MKAELVKHLARMGAHRVGVRQAREQLLAHAQQQLDDMGDAVGAMESGVEAGQGDILGQRGLRAKLDERRRLEAVVARLRQQLHGGES